MVFERDDLDLLSTFIRRGDELIFDLFGQSYAPEKTLLAYQFTLKTLAILSVGGGKVMLFLTNVGQVDMANLLVGNGQPFG